MTIKTHQIDSFSIPVHATNQDALNAGMTNGIYQTAAGTLKSLQPITQVRDKIYIWDPLPSGFHATTMRDTFLNEYPTIDPNRIILSDVYPFTLLPTTLSDVAIIIRSTTLLTSYFNAIRNAYQDYDVITFMPLGSNSSIQIDYTIPNMALDMSDGLVTCGAGDTQNHTAYGPELEFFDADEGGASWESSYSNPRIAAKFMEIKDVTNDDWDNVHEACRMTSSIPSWNLADGYGIINTVSALSFLGY